MTTIWVSSDGHWGHASIREYEPARQVWPDVQTMNEMLVVAWNKVVQPDDLVIYLGDFAMGKIADSLPYARRLNGRKWLVNGNHDRTLGRRPKDLKWRQAYHEVGFEVIVDELEFTFDGTPIRMCHFPYSGDHTTEDRYAERRPTDDGTLLIHGHVHSLWFAKLSAAGTPMINVGVDAVAVHTDRGYAPILLPDAIEAALALS